MRKSTSSYSFIHRLVDTGIIYATGFIALQIRFWNSAIPNESYEIFILGACIVYLLISSQAFNQRQSSSPTQQVVRISKRWLTLFLIILFVIVFTQSGNLLSRIWLVLWSVLAWFLLISGNLLVDVIFSRLHGRGVNKKKVAIIGSGFVATQLEQQINRASHPEYELISKIAHIDDESSVKSLSGQLLDEIWIALPIDESAKLPNLIDQLRFSSASIKFAPDLFTFRLINHGSTEILGVNMLNMNASPFLGEALLIKNLEDFILALFILILLSPLLLFLAMAVKLTSPGPVLYKQARVGLNGRPFKMLKFRSMPVDVEKSGVRWGNSESKTAHPFSRWMRRMNLDELPQFINVLMGQMSIVGPRPERVEFIDEFARQIPNYAKKHLVKAGITGWAQIHGLRGDTDLHKRIEYDLYYIENWSLLLDLKIILLTAVEPFLSKRASS